MNKKILLLLILILLFINYSTTSIQADTAINLQENEEELYHDIIVTLISPQVQKAILNYYGEEYLFDLWDVKILNIQRPQGERTEYHHYYSNNNWNESPPQFLGSYFSISARLSAVNKTSPHITPLICAQAANAEHSISITEQPSSFLYNTFSFVSR